MANADPVKPINGKKVILVCGVGAVVFTIVMGFGTYFLAQIMTPFLEKRAAASKTTISAPANPVQAGNR